MGLDIVRHQGRALRVKLVKEGIIQDWNNQQTDLKVCEDDLLIEVNGVSGDCQALMEAIEKESSLRLLFSRPTKE